MENIEKIASITIDTVPILISIVALFISYKSGKSQLKSSKISEKRLLMNEMVSLKYIDKIDEIPSYFSPKNVDHFIAKIEKKYNIEICYRTNLSNGKVLEFSDVSKLAYKITEFITEFNDYIENQLNTLEFDENKEYLKMLKEEMPKMMDAYLKQVNQTEYDSLILKEYNEEYLRLNEEFDINRSLPNIKKREGGSGYTHVLEFQEGYQIRRKVNQFYLHNISRHLSEMINRQL